MAGVEDASLEARILVEGLTDTSRTDALVAPDRQVSAEQAGAVRSALVRRIAGEPVHRILGWREFYGLKLMLSPDTLEPRPDTETLVDLALPVARRFMDEKSACRILDLGTGTGAIALALLSQTPGATALGVDISPDALATARTNADMNGIGRGFETLLSDWFGKVETRFHMIVSNPPYIATKVWEGLDREVREFDPRLALDAGEDGLEAYRRIAAGAQNHLEDDGMVAVEAGFDQAGKVADIFAAQGFHKVAERRDLGGRERALGFMADDMRSGER